MITRRDFIKGFGALALIPFVPEMVKPERSKILIHKGNVYPFPDIGDRYIRIHYETVTAGNVKAYIGGSDVQWDNTGTMTIPTREGRYKVKYTVHPDRTESEIVGEE